MRKYLFSLFLTLFVSGSFGVAIAADKVGWWEIQSIDTMKYSRDLAREKLDDKEFDTTIDSQMLTISRTGATHVAIGTPYDEEFLPFLKRWVKSARKHGLKVWFRGNFSGWEGWFEYEKIDRDAHKKLLERFILTNPSLFETGDLFSSCPECENGGPGDPRSTKDVAGHRQFLIAEYKISKSAFKKINKNVASNLFSMNLDVASEVMDLKTTRELGGLVTVDHYVKTPEETVEDLKVLADKSGGKVLLGEFGMPIPDIHGEASDVEQAEWVREVLKLASKERVIVGLNYWVSRGGSTELWTDKGVAKQSVSEISYYFSPPVVPISVKDELDKPISGVLLSDGHRDFFTGPNGEVPVPLLEEEKLIISHPDFKTEVYLLNPSDPVATVVLERKSEGVLFRFQKLLKGLLSLIER